MEDQRLLYIGLMSGTSMDAIDCILLRCASPRNFEVIATLEAPIDDALRDQIAELSQPGTNEIERLGPLDRELGSAFAQATNDLLHSSGHRAEDIAAIGSHGQTVRHQPPSSGMAKNKSFTLQLADPNTIAEETGITTVADFRRRDIAAGGEGAPLAPAFHAVCFTQEGVNRIILNVGGIANATLLQGDRLIAGFDTGPGNTLLDAWHLRHHDGERFDRDGQWAASGEVDQALLDELLKHPYFALTGPRSTGKEAFNLPWLDSVLNETSIEAHNVQATLLEFTAVSICNALASTELSVAEIYVCGGGAHNPTLMARLQALLPEKTIDSTAALGIGPDWVEAATFAWLARQTLHGEPGNAPTVSGAGGYRVLGAIFPA